MKNGDIMRTLRLVLTIIAINLALLLFLLPRVGLTAAPAAPSVDSRASTRTGRWAGSDSSADERGVERRSGVFGASEDGSGSLLANEATEPGVHALATRDRTKPTLARGGQRRVITP
jgi:hypothetical protein